MTANAAERSEKGAALAQLRERGYAETCDLAAFQTEPA